MLYFSNPKKGGQRKHHFLEYLRKKDKFTHFLIVPYSLEVKYSLPWPPFWPPFFRFEKYNISAFAGKKIKVSSFLDKILAYRGCVL